MHMQFINAQIREIESDIEHARKAIEKLICIRDALYKEKEAEFDKQAKHYK